MEHPRGWYRLSPKRQFEQLLPSLSERSLHELQARMDAGEDFDHVRVAMAMAKRDAARVTDRLPAMPNELSAIAAASGGREYELVLGLRSTDADAMIAVREEVIRECRQVRDMVLQGRNMASAWERVKLTSVFDASMPTIPRDPIRQRNKRRTKR